MAWERLLRRKVHPRLHDRDGSHPTLAGSYLAACVFLAVLFEENPVGIDSELEGLTRGEVKLLQQAAWAAARGQERPGLHGD
jgi:hypothetical protein